MRDMTGLRKTRTINKDNIEDILRLTSMQEGLLFHCLEDPISNYYFEQLILEISGEINDRCFEQAWNRVVEHNEMLRAIFRWEKVKQPVQLILKKYRVQLRRCDLTGKKSKEKKQLVEEIESRERQEGFDLHDVPFRVTLCKIRRKKYRMIVSSHHILYDGWSSGLILQQFFHAYGQLSQGTIGKTPVPGEPVKARFKDYVKWLEKWEAEGHGEENYWNEYLKGMAPQTELPIKTNVSRKVAPYSIKLFQDEPDSISFFLKQNKVTLAALFYTAWGILLQRYKNADDVIMGTTVSGRSVPIKGIEHTVGLFINTLPLRVRTGIGKSGFDLLRHTTGALQNRQVYESTPLVKIKEYIEWSGSEALFDTIVVVENYPLDTRFIQENSGLSITSSTVSECTHYVLTVTVKTVDGIEVDFGTNGCIDKRDIVHLSRHFKRIVQSITFNPMAPVTTIDMLSGEEKRQVLYDFNNTDADYPAGKAIHQLFAEQAAISPDKVALVGPAGGLAPLSVGSAVQHLTYRGLNQKSHRLAHQLVAKGVNPGCIVGIMMERSLEMLIGIFGILKAGAAYLPIDPGYPQERTDYILKDSNARILVREGMVELSNIIGPIFKELPTHPTQLCYIIYTSGSTGLPKGVMVEHCALVNRLMWMQKSYPLSGGDVVLQKTTVTFDVSVWELFWWAIAGVGLCLLEAGGEKDPAVIVNTVEKHNVTVIHFVPSMLQMMLEYIEKEGIAYRLKSLKQVFSSGESLSPSQVKRFNKLLPEMGKMQLTNLYGPTEATIDVSYYNCYGSGHVHEEIIPIGKPIDNIKLVILDSHRQLSPVSVPGELCISGIGLARGYLNKPELTAEKFIPSSLLRFSASQLLSFSLYRTGDRARWLPDGNIQFLGRIDQQVKVRGFRIELGEVENQLLTHPRVTKAVVVVREVREDETDLFAYIVPRSSKSIPVNELKEYLSQKLPHYMVPSSFLFLETLPLTSSGKIDRRSLPDPEGVRPVLKVSYAAPHSEIEKKVVELWKEILNLETVGVNDNFFDLGGHSLHIIRLTSRLKTVFNKEIPVTTLFRYPTIRSLVDHLKEGGITEFINSKESTQTANTIIGVNTGARGMEIAVIGMALRFPGARTIDVFWDNLKNGVESVTFFSDEQLEKAGAASHLITHPDYVRAKGVLENSDCFDAEFFEYSPREAQIMDPQLRILHECVWEALEHAGYDSTTYKGDIGFYLGALTNSAWLEQLSIDVRNHSDWLAVGSLTDRDFFSTRVAYKLNLRGPAVTVQTACSTSLVAIAFACRGLESGECDIALAGGVSISHGDEYGYLYQEGMVRSSDGHCRAFDAQANGTVGGNGAGIVVLKCLDKAAANGDCINAVIKGTAVNNDGVQKIGYTAPSVEGQAAVIRAAHQKAGIKPESISYIETHGTGTKLGDPVEIEALKAAFNTDKKQFCAIGSVKTNIGHMDEAAGVAGFIKTVLALKHRLIPPSLHFQRPNPAIDFDNSPFYVNTDLIPWESADAPLRAGVSSFGIGGTNVHVVVQAWSMEHEVWDDTEGNQLIVLSARTEAALDKVTRNLIDHLKKNRHVNLSDVAYTLQVGRRAFEHRRMAVVSGINDTVNALSSPHPPRVHTFFTEDNYRPVVFMFPGQGAQYVNMGLELYQKESIFREILDRCFDILKSLVKKDIEGILYPRHGPCSMRRANSKKLTGTHIAQPVLFAFEYALARLLMKWGLPPSAMIGHSIGEYAAACTAGVFSLEEALQLVALRGKLMHQMPAGAMLTISLPEERVIPFLTDGISLAAVNGPRSCVLSGPMESIQRLAVNLKEAGIQKRILHTSHAFHSWMMDPVLEEFQSEVGKIKLKAPQIPFISNVSGTWITKEEAVDPGYWAAHLRKTVRFADGLAMILKEAYSLLIEVGPGRALSTFVSRHPGKENTQVVINLVRHPKEKVSDHDFLLERIGRIWGSGVEIDWPRFHSFGGRHRIPLPTYPFNSRPFRPKKKMLPERGKKKDMADWFYVPVWRQSLQTEPPAIEGEERFTWVVFMDDTGFGRRLVSRLKHQGQTIVEVGKEACMDMNYEKLLETLPITGGGRPLRILHLWGVTLPRRGIENIFQTVDRELELGFYSLIHLAQAIGKSGLTTPIYIDVVTTGLQPVVGNETLNPGKAAVLGPVKIIPQEYPNVRCRSIDIQVPEPRSIAENKLIEEVMAELYSSRGEVVVAFRGNYRWLQKMESLRFEKNKELPPLLKEKGVYLITGGLGGIGFTLAEHLARRVKARLILVGRSALAPGGEWQFKRETLEKLGAEVQVSSCDVSDYKGMKAVISQAVRCFGPINGVLHAAGVADYAGIIQRRTRQMNETILAPKVKGTLVLDKLLEELSPDFVVLFSTIGTIAYGQKFGQVAYAAANEFLDVYAFHRNARTCCFTVSINWSDWQQVGMAVPAASHWAKTLRLKAAPDTLLTNALLPSEGVEAFERILCRNFSRVAVSPEDLETKIETSADAMQQLIEKRNTPIRETGDASIGEIQKTIASILQGFLGIESMGLHDNFFDMGVSSLDIIQINSQLREALQKEIPMIAMYTHPTVHSLARYLAGCGQKRGNREIDTSRIERLNEQRVELKRSKQAINRTIRKLREFKND